MNDGFRFAALQKKEKHETPHNHAHQPAQPFPSPAPSPSPSASASAQAFMAHYVSLCDAALRFLPVTPSTSVFFDEANRQVFTVRDNSTAITVASLNSAQDMRLT